MMPKITFYHLTTLLSAYGVWTVLNLLFALSLCGATHGSLMRLPLIWAWLHVVPLLSLGMSWSFPASAFLTVAAGASGIVSGLLIKERWAFSLIVIGMSIWFFWAYCVAGLAV
jgi:hypothetical protein